MASVSHSTSPPLATLDPRDFGLLCDGQSDDLPALQATFDAGAAITAAQTYCKGVSIHLPGTANGYRLSGPPCVRGTHIDIHGDRYATRFMGLGGYQGPMLHVGTYAGGSDVTYDHRPIDPTNPKRHGYRTYGHTSLVFAGDRMQLGGGPGGNWYYTPSGWKSNTLTIAYDLELPSGATWGTNTPLLGLSNQDGQPTPWVVCTGQTVTQQVLKLGSPAGTVSCIAELDPTKTRWGALAWSVNRSAGTVIFTADGVAQKVTFVTSTGIIPSLGSGFAFAHCDGTECHVVGSGAAGPLLGPGMGVDLTLWSYQINDDLGLVGQLVLDEPTPTLPTIGVRYQWGTGVAWVVPGVRPTATTQVSVEGIQFFGSHCQPAVVVGEVLDLTFRRCNFTNGLQGVATLPGYTRYPVRFFDCDGDGDDTAVCSLSSDTRIDGGTWQGKGRDQFRSTGARLMVRNVFLPALGNGVETVARMVGGSGSVLEIDHLDSDWESALPPTMTSLVEFHQSPDNTNRVSVEATSFATIGAGVPVLDYRGFGFSHQYRPTEINVRSVTTQDATARAADDPFAKISGPLSSQGVLDFASMPAGSGVPLAPAVTPAVASVVVVRSPTALLKTVSPQSP